MRKFIIFILIAMLLFNGLINERELNKLDIVSCIGIDITDEGDYQVTVSVLNTKKEGSGSSEDKEQKDSNNKNIYVATNSSIQEALRSIVKSSSKRLYLAHVDIIMLSEEVTKQKDIMDIMDYFVRDYEGGNNFILTILKDKSAKEAMQILSKNSNEFAAEIKDTILTSHKYIGNVSKNTLSDDLREILQVGQEVVINSIELEEIKNESESKEEGKENKEETEESSKKEESEKNYIYKLGKLVYFKDNKFGGYLEENDNRTHNILNNNIITTVAKINDKEDRIISEIISSDTSIKPEVKNGEYIVNIEQKLKGNITEVGENVEINKEEIINNLEEEFSELFKKYTLEYVDNCKNKYDADVIGFGNLFYRYKNKEYEKVKDKFYDEIYDNIKVNVNVEFDIINLGGVEKNWQ